MSYALPVGKSVEYFMRLMGQEIPDEYTMPDPETWEMRKKLIEEEYKEMREAYEAGDFAAFLDAAVDLVYVAVGAALDAGLTQFDEAFDAVHRANMEKAPTCERCKGTGFTRGHSLCGECAGKGRIVKRRVDGKILKPVGWVAPDIASIIWKETDARPHPPVTAAE